jgi:hypothetical protein
MDLDTYRQASRQTLVSLVDLVPTLLGFTGACAHCVVLLGAADMVLTPCLYESRPSHA